MDDAGPEIEQQDVVVEDLDPEGRVTLVEPSTGSP
jgi:hypothetical protein